MMMIKRLRFSLAVLVICGLFGFVFADGVLSQSSGTHVFVNPDPANATTCAETTIAIRVDAVENLTAFDLLITFDATVVEITAVENGGFLVAPDEPALYSPDNNDGDWNTDGFIRFGLAQQRDSLTGTLDPKTGDGDLALITLRALAPNASTDIVIDVDESMLVDWPDAFKIDFTAENGTVNTASCPPTDLDLSKFLVPENEPAGTEVGLFATTDPDPVDSFTYTLVKTGAYPDNTSFEILGDRLLTLESFNYETKSSYEIRVRSTDFGGLWIEETFKISVEDINDRPVAYDQTVIATEDQPINILLTGFDEDGDSLTFSVTELPKFGALSGTIPNLTYTPDAGYVGFDSFKFTVSDTELTSEVATVSIEIGSKWTVQYYFPIFSKQ
jgi:hypothetical protein